MYGYGGLGGYGGYGGVGGYGGGHGGYGGACVGTGIIAIAILILIALGVIF